MIIQRLFSLESGSYDGSRRTPRGSGDGILGGAILGGLIGAAWGGIGTSSKKGALIGGLAGAGLGAVTTWLSNISDQSSFNSGVNDKYNSWDFLDSLDSYFNEDTQDSEVTTSSTETNGNSSRTVTKKSIVRPKRDAEGIRYDIDGDPRKHVVNILFSGSAALYINKPTPKEISIIDKVLDDYCRLFKKADYLSEKVGKDSYFVDLKLIEGYENWVGIELIERGIKLNVITGQRFGIKKK